MSVQNGASRYSPGIMGSVHDPLLYDDSPISKDRRQFLIVCVFDSVLTTMLWLLSTVTKGDDWPQIFFNEINLFEPNFLKISMFDLVIVGVLRTVLLLIFFAGLRVEHWLPVACTTTITTGFIVVKILFFFKKDHGGLPQYLVLLASFSVAWFELWLVPFRVLPGERRGGGSAGSDVLSASLEAGDEELGVGGPGAAGSARSSARRSAVPFRRNKRTRDPSRRRATTTDDEFRSAVDYTTDEERNPHAVRAADILVPGFGQVPRPQALALLDEAARQLAQLQNELPLWKEMHRAEPLIRNRDNMFYLRAEVRCAPRVLYLAAWRDNECWNPQVTRMDYLVKLDAATDVVHVESAPALGGYIAARHFVDIRRVVHDPHADSYTCVYTSIPTPLKPEEAHGGVRGHNHANLVRVQRSAQSPDCSVFEWIMNTDVKTQVPKTLMRRGTVSFLQSYPKLLAKFVADRAAMYAAEL